MIKTRSIRIAAKPRFAMNKGGSVMSGDVLREYASRNGLCPICGETKTHKRQGGIFSKTWEPVTVQRGEEFVVYNGYCLQPTCYTLHQAQSLSRGNCESNLTPPSPKSSQSTSPTRRVNPNRGVHTTFSSGALTRSTQGSSGLTLEECLVPLGSDHTSEQFDSYPTDKKEIGKRKRGMRAHHVLERKDSESEDDNLSAEPDEPVAYRLIREAIEQENAGRVLELLKCHESNSPAIATECWAGLNRLGQASVLAVLEEESASLLIRQLSCYKRSFSVIMESLVCLTTMTMASVEIARQLVSNNVILAVLDIETHHCDFAPPTTPRSTQIRELCYKMLESLLASTDTISFPSSLLDRLQTHLSLPGTSDYVVRCLFHIAKKVCENSPLHAMLYSCLSRGSVRDYLWRKVSETGDNPAVNEAALFLLGRILTKHHNRQFCQAIIDHGGFEKFTAVILKEPVQNPEVVEYSCHIISGIFPYLQVPQHDDLASSMDAMICKLLDSCSFHPDAQEALLSLFLMTKRGGPFRSECGNLCGCLVQSLEENVAHVGLLRVSCIVIRRVFSAQMDRLTPKSLAEIVELIMGALLTHPNSEDLQEQGLITLQELVKNQKICDELELETMEFTLLGLINSNTGNAQIVSEGISTLNNLVVSETGEVAPIGEGVLDTLVLIMRLHEAKAIVQETACRLIKNFTYSTRSSSEELGKRTEDLIPLLWDAACNFPDECSEKVQYIIHKIC